MEMLIESHKKMSEHSIYIHGEAPERIVCLNQRSNVYLFHNEIGMILKFTSPKF